VRGQTVPGRQAAEGEGRGARSAVVEARDKVKRKAEGRRPAPAFFRGESLIDRRGGRLTRARGEGRLDLRCLPMASTAGTAGTAGRGWSRSGMSIHRPRGKMTPPIRNRRVSATSDAFVDLREHLTAAALLQQRSCVRGQRSRAAQGGMLVLPRCLVFRLFCVPWQVLARFNVDDIRGWHADSPSAGVLAGCSVSHGRCWPESLSMTSGQRQRR